MNRFHFAHSPDPFQFGEFQLQSQDGVKLYDGEAKTRYENGDLSLTSHRLIWSNPSVDRRCLVLPLQCVILVEEEAGGFMKSPKLILHLSSPVPGNESRPESKASNGIVKLSFRQGGEKSFLSSLHDALKQRQWEVTRVQAPPSGLTRRPGPVQPKKLRSGIGGIEKSIEQRTKKTDSEISKAFQDLDKLMEMAKPMVTLAKSISGKIRDKQGEVTDDETVQFKSYLLSLGISDPVTRETHGTGQSYFKELSREVYRILEKPIQESGGMMTLTDAFCRVNRARGLELLSPEDLLSACKALKSIGVPLELHTFSDSGVIVLRDPSLAGTKALIEKTKELLIQSGNLTAEDLSRLAGISVILAKERLLATESAGLACRDDTVEGIRFYPNKFLSVEE